jgi:hypothetical protein
VVEGGRIIERGTHESLYAAGGRYYDLYTKQHAVASNLFLAPGESSSDGEEPPEGNRTANNGGGKDAGVTDAMRLIRGQT